MPLRRVDPTRPTNPLRWAANQFGRSPVGQIVAKLVVARTDVVMNRISGGHLNWGMFSIPSATLETVGAKSGQIRRSQVAYFHDNDDVIVIASNFGGTQHPNWFHNLKANPECALGGEEFTAREVTDADTYQRLFDLAAHYYRGFADYRARTDASGRRIPVLRLTPVVR